MTMAGWVIATLFYKASFWRWYDGLFTCVAGVDKDGSTRIWGKPNAQTLGWIEIYDTEDSRNMADLRVHETVHVVQAFTGSLVGLVAVPVLLGAFGGPLWIGLVIGGFVGGLGFAGLYGILFIYLLLRDRMGWYQAYRMNPFEVQAYDLQDKYLAGENPKAWGI
jgi:hypothetical protein